MKGMRGFLKSKRVGHAVLVLMALGLVYLVFVRGIRNFLVPSSSMEPTLLVGDYMVTLRANAYDRGDIVVVRDGGPGEYIVKRIVGLAGDTVQILDGALYVNDRYVSEPYIQEPMRYLLVEPQTVPGEHVFLLGDNRNNSEDSATEHRTFPVSDIVGRVRFIYYPYARFGPVRSYPLSTLIAAVGERGSSVVVRE